MKKNKLKVAIGSDHVGLILKPAIKKYLISIGYEVIDYGTKSSKRTDYPIYGKKVGEAVAKGECSLGITICGTGVGIGMAASKVKGTRVCICSDCYSAKLSRMHNNSNILSFGSRVVGEELAKMIVKNWLEAKFIGGRHERRVKEIESIENGDDQEFDKNLNSTDFDGKEKFEDQDL
ncbi:ribose 5-phosphate isomerase B [Lactobacillus panisapium]|uniref:ribose 5-phosphate isomerase B n=1 Tax=Lactobacillus panisapium TaxID=2012495 RepID=UPI001C69448D|nr:ribose 5-phosphate isomerase B [Lactobacillus panisapium]QYN56932.1 ribose 5-phosphate isomerase B [Lactobacillus panisapium]